MFSARIIKKEDCTGRNIFLYVMKEHKRIKNRYEYPQTGDGAAHNAMGSSSLFVETSLNHFFSLDNNSNEEVSFLYRNVNFLSEFSFKKREEEKQIKEKEVKKRNKKKEDENL